MATANPDGTLTLTTDERTGMVEWLSEEGDLSYMVAPDPNPVGIDMRLRVQSMKHIMLADPAPAPPTPPAATFTMYDSTVAADIPTDAKLVLGYVDGAVSQWSGLPEQRSGDWGRWPSTTGLVTITTTGGNIADECDAEDGDLTPDNAASFVQMYPGTVVYTNLANVGNIRAAMEKAGLPPSQYGLHIAHYTGQAHICDSKCVATVPGLDPHVLDGLTVYGTQYANPDWTGAHYDLSLMTQAFVDRFMQRGQPTPIAVPKPALAPAPTPLPVDQQHVVTGPDDDLIEKDNYQGTDETCGERVVAMAAAEDNIIPVDFGTDQAFALELLNTLGPGLDPNTFGGTNLDQQLGLLQYVARKYGKQLQVVGVAAVEGLRDPNYQHKSIACNLGPMLGPNFATSNHFLLQRKVGGDVGDGYVKVIDSDQFLDYSKDAFTEDQVLAGATALFGQGAQFGWAWNWL